MAEVEFRTGKREIPDHLAAMMAGLDTITLTYEQAIDEANKMAEANVLNRAVDTAVSVHAKEFWTR
jgi:hypothetical protein